MPPSGPGAVDNGHSQSSRAANCAFRGRLAETPLRTAVGRHLLARRSYLAGPEIPRSHRSAVRNRTFLKQASLPRHEAPSRRPELVSEINVAQPPLSQGSATVTPWDIYSAMPASPPPTSNPSSRSTPWSAPAAIGCSPRPPAAPAPTGPPSP